MKETLEVGYWMWLVHPVECEKSGPLFNMRLLSANKDSESNKSKTKGQTVGWKQFEASV